MVLTKEMLDELVGGCKSPQDVEKLYSQMLQHMINRALEAEMQAHLGHERHRPTGAGNPRSCFSQAGSERGGRAGDRDAARPRRQL